MSINKNKSEIVESFKNLLKKADEVQSLEKNNKSIQQADKNEIKLANVSKKVESNYNNTSERLGIRDIKRVPSNPFKKQYKEQNKEKMEKFEHEVTNKINNILNRHLYHWLNRELPKYSKIKLRKYIYELLTQLIK
ncbi:MAG: hypothetical protein CFH34_00658 [Alphaproteobacteria bacterium MarineAlpha9_Bin4]|nr:hypothetical protein [Pelagibacterales bacterium]PPR26898.1 MAG: hypothetical protein CFH34_00658 [Alphaproteobacteria bacterium MarineAlpha9_Bin4]|tara:strand:- start:1720 stop:2127 length:408 start_codon:yes stop_codon:yes gene_type:complete